MKLNGKQTRDLLRVVCDAWLSRCSRGLSRCSRGGMSQPLFFCRIWESWLVCWLACWRLLADSAWLAAGGKNGITANLLGSMDLYGCGGWAGRTRCASISIICNDLFVVMGSEGSFRIIGINGFPYVSWILWWSGNHGRAQHHCKHIDFHTFSLFLWWNGKLGKLQNHWKQMDFYTFSLFLWWSGEHGKLQNIQNIWISYIFIISLVERRAWEAPESLKTHRFVYILIISLV